MEKEIEETVSSLDEKDDEESEEQKKEDQISYPCPPSNESNSLTHTFFDIDIMSIVFIAIFKYVKIFRFVESNIILLNQRSNFISTLKSNKNPSICSIS